jgi:hypothetical protein
MPDLLMPLVCSVCPQIRAHGEVGGATIRGSGLLPPSWTAYGEQRWPRASRTSMGAGVRRHDANETNALHLLRGDDLFDLLQALS